MTFGQFRKIAANLECVQRVQQRGAYAATVGACAAKQSTCCEGGLCATGLGLFCEVGV